MLVSPPRPALSPTHHADLIVVFIDLPCRSRTQYWRCLASCRTSATRTPTFAPSYCDPKSNDLITDGDNDDDDLTVLPIFLLQL
ncbi:hypothetical protein ANO14919_010420 [Xylariales sp. No.14919]|nr:hypothetical protein ANO14919_010420 [Xylariales sp. No.14919]